MLSIKNHFNKNNKYGRTLKIINYFNLDYNRLAYPGQLKADKTIEDILKDNIFQKSDAISITPLDWKLKSTLNTLDTKVSEYYVIDHINNNTPFIMLKLEMSQQAKIIAGRGRKQQLFINDIRHKKAFEENNAFYWPYEIKISDLNDKNIKVPAAILSLMMYIPISKLELDYIEEQYKLNPDSPKSKKLYDQLCNKKLKNCQGSKYAQSFDRFGNYLLDQNNCVHNKSKKKNLALICNFGYFSVPDYNFFHTLGSSLFKEFDKDKFYLFSRFVEGDIYVIEQHHASYTDLLPDIVLNYYICLSLIKRGTLNNKERDIILNTLYNLRCPDNKTNTRHWQCLYCTYSENREGFKRDNFRNFDINFIQIFRCKHNHFEGCDFQQVPPYASLHPLQNIDNQFLLDLNVNKFREEFNNKYNDEFCNKYHNDMRSILDIELELDDPQKQVVNFDMHHNIINQQDTDKENSIELKDLYHDILKLEKNSSNSNINKQNAH